MDRLKTILNIFFKEEIESDPKDEATENLLSSLCKIGKIEKCNVYNNDMLAVKYPSGWSLYKPDGTLVADNAYKCYAHSDEWYAIETDADFTVYDMEGNVLLYIKKG